MSADRQWRRDEEVPAAVRDEIQRAVVLHGRQQTQGSDARDIAVALWDGDELIAGGWGRTEFQRLYVSYLWVREYRRGQGLGGDCLRQLEAQALRRGCVDAMVETLLDDVSELLEHLGYVCMAHVHDYVPGFTRHIMLKVWTPRD